MKSLSIRNLPDDVYLILQKLAKDNRRSLQEQVKIILEKETILLKESSLSKASSWRNRLKKRGFSDSVKDIREDRDR